MVQGSILSYSLCVPMNRMYRTTTFLDENLYPHIILYLFPATLKQTRLKLEPRQVIVSAVRKDFIISLGVAQSH